MPRRNNFQQSIDSIRNNTEFVSNVANVVLFSFAIENYNIFDEQQRSLYEKSIACVCWFRINSQE